MTLLKYIQQLSLLLRCSFIPNKCPVCNKIKAFDDQSVVCEKCLDKLKSVSDNSCLKCGAGVDRCKCKKHHVEYDGLVAPFYYEDIAIKIVSLFKYRYMTFFASFFAKEMAKKVKGKYENITFDYIAYIPFSSMQKRKRNYNQSELLAEELSKILNIPQSPLIIKLYNNKSQHYMKNQNRKGNVAGVYQIDVSVDLTGKKILLVDDIKTTGATLNECARELKLYGAEEVYCVTALITNKKKKSKQ